MTRSWRSRPVRRGRGRRRGRAPRPTLRLTLNSRSQRSSSSRSRSTGSLRATSIRARPSENRLIEMSPVAPIAFAASSKRTSWEKSAKGPDIDADPPPLGGARAARRGADASSSRRLGLPVARHPVDRLLERVEDPIALLARLVGVEPGGRAKRAAQLGRLAQRSQADPRGLAAGAGAQLVELAADHVRVADAPRRRGSRSAASSSRAAASSLARAASPRASDARRPSAERPRLRLQLGERPVHLRRAGIRAANA